MKAILNIRTQSGINGKIFVKDEYSSNPNEPNFVVEINNKQIETNNIICLNPHAGEKSFVSLHENDTNKLFGKSIAAKIEVVSFADGSEIPTGNSVQVNDVLRLNNELSKEMIIEKIKETKSSVTTDSDKKYTGKIVESGHGFKMKDTKSNWEKVSKFGFDAIEKVN